ncbi:DUF6019 family protein [Heyndrickxia sporothermodurans]
MAYVVMYIIGLIVLYFVIEHAVVNGINKSKLGEYIDSKIDYPKDRINSNKKKSFLENDLDN